MSRILSVLILVLTVCTFAIGESRIKYDPSCITIDGKDTFIYSGAFHYFRCPRELWRDRLAKMKEAGLNCVETYVAWNWHEPTPPADLNDKSKFVRLDELDEFLRLAEDEFGMYTIVRPGPYICAEWESGGFPNWLSTFKPKDFKGTWLRSADPVFAAWSKHYLDEVARVVKPHLITSRPSGKKGVILWQIENEYNYAPQSAQTKHDHLVQLLKISRDAGIDVPIFTCLSRNDQIKKNPELHANVIETLNSYPGYGMNGLINGIKELDAYQPDKFKMVTELQGGWFAQVGGQLSENQGHNAAQINHISIVCIEYGMTSLNYYMFFGGTNFGGWGSDNQVSSYDYNAPIREHGGVGDRWLACKALGAFLADHGLQLTRTQPVDINIVDKIPDGVSVTMRRAQDGSRFIFLRNSNRQNTQKGSVTIRPNDQSEIKFDYELGQFGAKILYVAPDGKQDWYPKEQTYPPEPAQADLPQPVELKNIRTQSDPGPKEWISIKPEQTLEEAGVFDSRMVYYRGKLNLPDTNANYNAIVKVGGHDNLSAMIDGKLIPAKPGAEGLFLDTGKYFKPGSNDFQLIYNNAGHPNGGAGIEIQKGVRSILLTRSDIPNGVPLKSWRFKVVDSDSAAKSAVTSEFDDSSWAQTELTDRGQLNDNGVAVFRTSFDYNEGMQKNGLDQLSIGSIDEEGDIYLNGEKIGESRDWAKRTNVSMSGKIKNGLNTLAIIVRNQQGMGGMSRGASIRATLSGANAVTELSIGFPQGEEIGYANADFDDANWVTQDDIKTRSPESGLLIWVRMPFELTKPKAGVWAPYKLHLEAQGEGYVYLNGHNLGRYWQAGPQRDYYLPECWLNFDGKQNVISLCFRTLDKPVGVEKAVVSVYKDFAEKR